MQPPTLDDLDAIASLYRDPRVRAYLGGPLDGDAAIAVSRGLLNSAVGNHAWVVRRAGDSRFCGLVTLGPHHDGEGTEISFQFDPALWGTGIAGESVARVIGHAERVLGIDHILAETQAANTMSRRLLERCGMYQIASLWRFGAEQLLYSTDSSRAILQTRD